MQQHKLKQNPSTSLAFACVIRVCVLKCRASRSMPCARVHLYLDCR